MTADNRPIWARPTEGGWLLDLRIQPGARRSELVGPLGTSLKIRVAAPANDGKANAELIRFVAEWLDVPRRSVSIVRGQTSRDKAVLVQGVVEWGLIVTPSEGGSGKKRNH
jgi:uncharacterized protein